MSEPNQEGYEDEPFDYWEEDDYPASCQHCDEFGMVVVCCDDMCRAAGECMHGADGMAVCPYCGGEDKL